ncbi:hypothetical protein ALC62_03725, partial [Cyphomyrmex costatus]
TRRIVDEFIHCADVLSTKREGEHRALAVVNVPVAIARACFERKENATIIGSTRE